MKERVLTPAEEKEDRLHKLEVYIKSKDAADSFYHHALETIEDIDIEDVINKYCQSAISLDSLESQHKNKEVQKQTKQRQGKEHQSYLYCLLRENSLFGKYFQQIDLNMSTEAPLSVEGLIMFYKEQNDNFERQKVFLKQDQDFLFQWQDGLSQVLRVVSVRTTHILSNMLTNFEMIPEL